MRPIRRLALGLACGLGVLTTAASGEMTAIRGKAIFKGNADDYKRTVIDTSKDPNCKKIKDKIGTDVVIINKKNDPTTLENVLVSIKAGLGDKVFPVPSPEVKLNQKGCHYEPHVLTMMEGQILRVINSDDTNHNINFYGAEINEQFNFSQPTPDTVKGKELKLKKEAPFGVKCDVHPWMGAYIAVFSHPFFSVTGNDGTFELKGMPPGKYVVEAWHEKFGTLTAEIELSSAGDQKTHDFVFEPK